jgi:hypothetical protein
LKEGHEKDNLTCFAPRTVLIKSEIIKSYEKYNHR